MRKVAAFILDHRIIWAVVILGITLILGFFLRDLQIDSDMTRYFPANDPVVGLFNYIGENFGGNYIAIIALENEDIFSRASIEDIHRLTGSCQQVPGVAFVTSLTHVTDIKQEPDGLITIGQLIDENRLPQSESELNTLKNYTLSNERYAGKLVSWDGTATILVCQIENSADKTVVARELKEIVAKLQPRGKVYFSGLPFYMLDLNDIIQTDLKLLTPLAIAMMAVIMLISFRHVVGMVLPLLSVLLSIIWTLGLMGLLRVPMAIISNATPVILIVIGSAYGIHVLSKAFETQKDPTKLNSALAEVFLPITLAALTTMFGFISFIFGSYLTMIRVFGLFTALGILAALLISLTLIPIVLVSLFHKQRAIRLEFRLEGKAFKFFASDRLYNLIFHPGVSWALLLVFIGINIAGIPRIQRNTDLFDYFQPGSNLRQSENFIQRKFGGSIPIYILVRGDIQSPAVLTQMRTIENFLQRTEQIFNTQSIVNYIEEMNEKMGEGKQVPDRRDKVANLMFLLEGEEIMTQMINFDNTEALITATMGKLETRRMITTLDQIRNLLASNNSAEVQFSLTGIHSIYEHLDHSLIRSQIQSLIIAMILVFACLVVLQRSFVGGLVGMIPILFTLSLVFGFMGYTGIPLDVATVLVGSVAIGIGIDYPIHFISRFKLEFQKGRSVPEALQTTLKTTGIAILINVTSVMLGFLVLLFSNLVPLQRFGMLIAITMIGSGFATLVILPGVIQFARTSFVRRLNRS